MSEFRSVLQASALENKKIWITGGGSGLGRAMALRFASLGASVGVSGRREEPLKETVEKIKAEGGNATHATMDVRDPEAVQSAFQKVQDSLGGLDGLVNNAAGNFLAPSESLSPNAFNSIVGIVLHGTFHCTSIAGKAWIKAGTPGTVLNITTTYAETGSAYVLPSACAKAGVLALTKSLTSEWGRYNIRLNTISPGPIPTEGAFTRLLPDPRILDKKIKQMPAGRLGTPEELAELAAFMMSDATEWMRGETVTFDGGELVRNSGEFNWLLDLDIPWDEMAARGRKKGE